MSCAGISSNPYTQIASPNAAETSATSGICLLCQITDPTLYVIQPDPKTTDAPAAITTGVGVAGYGSITVTDTMNTYNNSAPSNLQRAGFIVGSPSGVLTAGVLGGVTITTIRNGVDQESSTLSTTLRLDALGTTVAGGVAFGYVSFIPTTQFDALRVSFGATVSALATLNVYDACVSQGAGQTPP